MTVTLEFEDFSLIGPVSTQFTNYFAISLKNSCVRRKHRIKILKTICTRYCNYLMHMVFRFPIYNTGPVKNFSKQNPKKNTDKSPCAFLPSARKHMQKCRHVGRYLLCIYISGKYKDMKEGTVSQVHPDLPFIIFRRKTD